MHNAKNAQLGHYIEKPQLKKNQFLERRLCIYHVIFRIEPAPQ